MHNFSTRLLRLNPQPTDARSARPQVGLACTVLTLRSRFSSVSTTQSAAASRALPARPRMLRFARRTSGVRAMATAAAKKPPLRGVVCDMDGARPAGAA